MFRYVAKRLFLFIPTLVLISCLTFFLSKMVPADQVSILLNLQGIDDSFENWEEEYISLNKRMGLDLPVFYFTIKPNYIIDTDHSNLSLKESDFAQSLSSLKYTETYIRQWLDEINKCPEHVAKKMLACQSIDQLRNAIVSNKESLSNLQFQNLNNLLDVESESKIKWHYPTLQYHGTQNQYHHWISKIITGDFGVSLLDTRPVTDKLWEAMKWSVLLVFLNILFVLIISFPLGVYNGINAGSSFDNISNNILYGFYAIPKFWMATLLIIFFTTAEYGGWTNIFPTVGLWDYGDSNGFFAMLAKSWPKLILPLLVLVIPDVAYLSRLIRASVREESNKEYIKTALSKGLSKRQITTRHILPNSLIPTIALLVGALPGALASGLIVEVIFNIPGVGRLMFVSIQNADWSMVYPIVFVISVFAVIIFLVGDLLMAYLNPKIKLG